MDSTSEALKFKTWLLKVSIHCEGCRRKVKKALQSIDGVFTTTVDSQQHKVTVTGNVGVETLIRKLAKAGKHAEVWPENFAPDGKGNHSDKVNKKKMSEQRDTTTLQNHSSSATKHSNKDGGIENAEKCKKKNNSKNGAGLPGKSPAGGQKPEMNSKGGKSISKSEGGTRKSGGGEDSNAGKKKKKVKKVESGENGRGSIKELRSSGRCSAGAHTGSQSQCPPGQVVGQVNLSPTRQQSYMYYPETCYTPLVHYAGGGGGGGYNNRLCPSSPMGTMGLASAPSYYVPPLPYMFTEPYQFQSQPLISFEIFSDENANGCSVM